MYTIAVKSCTDNGDDYERYEIDKNVYYYIRSLETAMDSVRIEEALRGRYPKRFNQISRENHGQ